MSEQIVSRRGFLKGIAAVAGFPAIVPSSVFGANAPSNRIVMGCIGVGGMGTSDMNALMAYDDVQVAAVCDVNRGSNDYGHWYKLGWQGNWFGREPGQKLVDAHYAQKNPSGKAKGCTAHLDFREIIERDDIDAVTVVTPDHWHAVIECAAARAGKHIYGEKPLALTIAEGQALVKAVHENGVTFQTGTHHRSNQQARFAMELVRNGRIGKLERIKVTVGPSHKPGPEGAWEPQPVPDYLDYDMWLGPAPWAPYHKDRCLYNFRFFMDYAGGNLTNNGVHMADMAQWGNGTEDTGPVEVEYQGGTFPRDGLYDASNDIKFTLHFAKGAEMIFRTDAKVDTDVRFEGTKGWVDYSGSTVTMAPESLWREQIGPEEIHLYKSLEHHRNFLDCVKSGGRPITPVEVGHRSTALCHLGNICMTLGRSLKWDPAREEFPGDEQANRLLSRAMRPPWHV